jgi:hypothetical protein
MLPIDHRVSPKLLHIPLQPPRVSVPREGLFLALWQQFAEQRPEEWRYIFITNGPIRQRAASVAASFMTFMGCNCGRDFTRTAERLATSGSFTCTEDAYLAAWAQENKRNQGVNHGLRTIEYMLAREHPIKLLFYKHRVNWKQVPDVSMEDMDIVESMVRWWSSITARYMRDAVEAQMKARVATEFLRTDAQAAAKEGAQ